MEKIIMTTISKPSNDPGGGFNVTVFRAKGYWERNLRGLPMVGAMVAAFFLVLGGIIVGITRTLPLLSVLFLLFGIGMPMAIFLGKLGAMFPYAVELDEGRGIRFYSALGDIYLPIDQVKSVRWSWLFGGWVVSSRQRYGLLTGFLIHFTWGTAGNQAAAAIKEEIRRAGAPFHRQTN